MGETVGDKEPMRYSGAPNAFLLELFAMHSDYDERLIKFCYVFFLESLDLYLILLSLIPGVVLIF